MPPTVPAWSASRAAASSIKPPRDAFYQQDGVLHQAELPRADDVSGGFGQWQVKADHVRLGEQLLERYKRKVASGGVHGISVWVVGEDRHPETMRHG